MKAHAFGTHLTPDWGGNVVGDRGVALFFFFPPLASTVLCCFPQEYVSVPLVTMMVAVMVVVSLMLPACLHRLFLLAMN